MTLSRDFIIGLFVIVALAILTVVTVSLRHWDFFSRRSTYYAIFEQSSGLTWARQSLFPVCRWAR